MEESMIGKKVKYRDETWEVVHVTEGRRAIIVQIGVDVKMGAIRVDPVAVMVDLDEIEEIPHELTAKEYAEKLREGFGVKLEAVDNFEDLEICDGVNCRECPFDKRLKAAGYRGNCIALIVYHPDLAVKLMDEWQAEKSKPKGKTYLQDFVEKHPNARIAEEDGVPYICVKNVYGVEAGRANNCAEGHCAKCWSEVMPEEDNGEG